jgi:hypothetical protein
VQTPLFTQFEKRIREACRRTSTLEERGRAMTSDVISTRNTSDRVVNGPHGGDEKWDLVVNGPRLQDEESDRVVNGPRETEEWERAA